MTDKRTIQLNPLLPPANHNFLIHQIKQDIIKGLEILDAILNSEEDEQLIIFLNNFADIYFTQNEQLSILKAQFLQILTHAEDKFNKTMWQSQIKNIDGNKKWEKFKGFTRAQIQQTCTKESSPLLTTFFEDIYVPKSEIETHLYNLKQEASTLFNNARTHITSLMSLNLNSNLAQTQTHQFVLT